MPTESKKAPKVVNPNATQRKVLDDVVTWAEMAKRSGVPKNKLSQWYLRDRFGMRLAAVRPDMRPPLFLWSTVKPIIEAAKSADNS